MLTVSRAEGFWQPPPGTEVSYFEWGRYMHSPGLRALGVERRPEAESPYFSVPQPVWHLSHRPLDLAVVTGEEAGSFLTPLLAQSDRLVVATALPVDDTEPVLDRLEAAWLDLGPQTEAAIYDTLSTVYRQRSTGLSRALLSGEICSAAAALTELGTNNWQLTDTAIGALVAGVFLEATRLKSILWHRKELPDRQDHWRTISSQTASVALAEVYDTYIGLPER